MSATPSPSPVFRVTDPATGLPLPGAKIYTYVGGTASTPKTTWADAAKVGANLNPVVTDADGQAQIYIDGDYKFAVHDPDDVLLYEIDHVLGGSTAFDRPASGVTSLPFDDITSETVQDALEELGAKRVKDTDVIAIAQGGTGQSTAPAAIDALTSTAEVSVTAASTTDIATAASQKIVVPGNTTIAAFGTAAAGILRWVRFTGTPQITYNATSMISPTGRTLKMSNGAFLLAESLGSGNWRILFVEDPALYKYLNTQIFTATGTYTPTPGMRKFKIKGVAPGGGSGGADLSSSGAEEVAAVGGSGAGAACEGWMGVADITATVAVTIGTRGAAGANTGGDGADATDSSFGAYIVLKGGKKSSGILTSGYVVGDGAVPTSGSTVPANFLLVEGNGGGMGARGDGGASSQPIRGTSGEGGSPGLGFGDGGKPISVVSGSDPGLAGTGYGYGCSGAVSKSTTGDVGAQGGPSIFIIEEYA